MGPRWQVAILGSLTIAVTAGCSMLDSRGVDLLKPPPPEQMKMSTARADRPFAPSLRGGSSVRSSFSTVESGYAIEVQDHLVAPAQKAVDVEVAGAAAFEVREGAGSVTIAGRTTVVTMGATFVVSEGEKIRVEATGGPMILRAYQFKSQ